MLGETTPMTDTSWPAVDESARVRNSVTLVVQVNGKLRARLELPAGISKEEAQDAAMSEPNIMRHIDGKTIRKVILVPDKLLNIVAN